jgi:hypothetical protein
VTALPRNTKANWLRNSVIASLILHAAIGGIAKVSVSSRRSATPDIVDIELAPPPPRAEALPEEKAKPDDPDTLANQNPKSNPSTEPQPDRDPTKPGDTLWDAAVATDAAMDAPIDAATDARVRPDARPRSNAGLQPDANSVDLDAEPMTVATANDAAPPAVSHPGSSSATADASVSNPSDAQPAVTDAAATPDLTAMGSAGRGSGADNLPAVDGAPTTVGTAANLLYYFPKGHQIAVLVRFDRLRGTRWQAPAEKLFKPMPDYGVLFGASDVKISDRFDMLVISTPAPKDATATTLVGKTALSRQALRAFLEQPETPVTWSVVKGGMLGTRGGTRKSAGDQRMFLSPYQGWLLLSQPADFAGYLTPAKGDIDKAEIASNAKGWLSVVRTTEAESGDKRGPSMVMTLTLPTQRIDVPDIGLGVDSLPSPSRLTLAMEVTKSGWLLRGSMKFANEADATEFTDTVNAVRARVKDNPLIQRVLKRSHAQNVVNGLSVSRTADRVSYGTSISISDADGALAYAAQAIAKYFGRQQ